VYSEIVKRIVHGCKLSLFVKMVDGKLTNTKSSLNPDSTPPLLRVDCLSFLNILGNNPFPQTGLEAQHSPALFPGGLVSPGMLAFRAQARPVCSLMLGVNSMGGPDKLAT
jgi:hypothetical protein